MASRLDLIDTIAIVIMENRSFDHVLGYLSLSPFNRKVNGLQDDVTWRKKYSNFHDGAFFDIFRLDDTRLPNDPPHDRDSISMQMGSLVNNEFTMTGFVRSYAATQNIPAGSQPVVMGHYGPTEVPIADFFAQWYGICDHWFSPLPASTQPNRLMAMSGYTLNDKNVHVLPRQDLVYDWLNRQTGGVRWKVYHQGIPFFALMPHWIPEIVAAGHFRNFDNLVADVQALPDKDYPQVIFIEPMYTDAPHQGDATDDHPPSSIRGGQEFLRQVYLALSSNPKRWQRTLLIVTYDEHGGFFDHESPAPIKTPLAPDSRFQTPFTTAGCRVPAFIISPLVEPGFVYDRPMDTTAILKLLGQKFGHGNYSEVVDARSYAGSIADSLRLDAPRTDIPQPPRAVGFTPALTDNSVAFRKAMQGMWNKDDVVAREKFPELWHEDEEEDSKPGNAGGPPVEAKPGK